MNQLVRNEQTGFLESVAKFPQHSARTPFDSARKVAFLELANEMADKEQAPNLTMIARKVGITLRTFYDHLQQDSEFKDAWDETKLKIEDALNRSLIRSGVKGAQGTTAAIFWLKNRVGERWSDGNNQISLDIGQLKNVLGKAEEFIDAEIVKPKQLPSIKEINPTDIPTIDPK